MATKRTRSGRHRRQRPLSPAELWWLTGERQPGQNPFETMLLGRPTTERRLARCRALLDEHGDLVPAWRRPILERLLRREGPDLMTTDEGGNGA